MFSSFADVIVPSLPGEPEYDGSGMTVGIIAGIVTVVLIAAIIAIVLICGKKKNQAPAKQTAAKKPVAKKTSKK